MKEQTNERIEQKLMNKILSKTKEIEESSFFRHDNRLFRQFPAYSARIKLFFNRNRQCFGHCYYAFFNKKSVKNLEENAKTPEKYVN